MIKVFFQNLSKFFYLLMLRVLPNMHKYKNFKDLNFKQNDFTNYRVVKHYILKENFIHNISILNIHSFDFLLFYQKLGGKKGIELSKKNIFLWFKKFKYEKNFPWTYDYASKRLINIIYNYDFICSILDEKDIKFLDYILNFHIKRIIFDLKRKDKENISSFEVLALLLIETRKDILNKNIIKKIEDIIFFQIDENSMHKSYNLLEHTKFLNNLIEIRNIFLFYDLEIPNVINRNILAMTSILKNYLHDDLSLPLFNGCNNNHNKSLQKIYEKEQFLVKKDFENFKNGIAVYKDSQKTLFFDAVQPTRHMFQKDLSAGTLSVEFSAEGEKIITNCGGTEILGKNPGYLKYSAAHSTIIINNTNISEINEDNINKQFPKKVFFESQKDSDENFLSASHNGYQKNYRKICKRNLFINLKKGLIKGEDTIISTKSNVDKIVFHIRFHLMPQISTTITESKKNLIVRTKKNKMWLFKSDKEIMVEKSIYVENDRAIETSQIVIGGITSSLRDKIKWSLEKM